MNVNYFTVIAALLYFSFQIFWASNLSEAFQAILLKIAYSIKVLLGHFTNKMIYI